MIQHITSFYKHSQGTFMKHLLLFLATIITVGCSSSKEYTVDYLYANDDIRNQVVADCKLNKQTETNCKNASEAEAKKFNSTGGKKVQKW